MPDLQLSWTQSHGYTKLQRGLGNVFLAKRQCFQLKTWSSFIKKEGENGYWECKWIRTSPYPSGLLGRNACLLLSLPDDFINLCQSCNGFYWQCLWGDGTFFLFHEFVKFVSHPGYKYFSAVFFMISWLVYDWLWRELTCYSDFG